MNGVKCVKSGRNTWKDSFHLFTKEKRVSNEKSAINISLKKEIEKVTTNIPTKERNHINVKLVALTLYRKKTYVNMFRRFMKEKRIFNVASLAIRDFGKKVT